MMSRFLKLLLLVLLATLPIAARAGFNYSTNDDGTITVSGYTGSSTTVDVPSAVGGRPVTTIGAGGFGYNIYLTRVTLPITVTNLVAVDGVFVGIPGLMSIVAEPSDRCHDFVD